MVGAQLPTPVVGVYGVALISATPQSVDDINRHSVLSGDRIRQRETSSGSRHKDTDQCLSPSPSAGTAVSLFRAKTVQQRPLLPREVVTRLPDCGVRTLGEN